MIPTLLLTLLSITPTAAPEPPSIDVGDLTVPIPSFGMPQDMLAELPDVEAMTRESRAEALLALARAVAGVPEDVRLDDGLLVVNPADSEAVGRAMDELRADRRLVGVTVRLLDQPPEGVSRRDLAEARLSGGRLTIIDPPADARGQIAAPRLTMFDGQQAWVAVINDERPASWLIQVRVATSGEQVLLSGSVQIDHGRGEFIDVLPPGRAGVVAVGDRWAVIEADLIEQRERDGDAFPRLLDPATAPSE